MFLYLAVIFNDVQHAMCKHNAINAYSYQMYHMQSGCSQLQALGNSDVSSSYTYWHAQTITSEYVQLYTIYYYRGQSSIAKCFAKLLENKTQSVISREISGFISSPTDKYNRDYDKCKKI